jgi:hypothetical protein
MAKDTDKDQAARARNESMRASARRAASNFGTRTSDWQHQRTQHAE